MRSSESSSLTFLLNYNELPVEILLKEPRTDLLTGQTLVGKFIMDGFGVLVLQ
ncbi:hypothetical protein D3C76_1666480 [compost metagenome]